MHNTSFDFQKNIRKALADGQLRKNLKFAMDTMTQKRKAVFSDEEELQKLRNLGNAIRRRALSRLPDLLEQLEKKCRENGIQVHWAETTAQANETVLSIMKKHGAERMVKGKSMVSEEMHLNAFLMEHGFDVMETDLGEYIIQLAGETPSHIIVPAIHKNKDEIARLFHEKIPGTPYTEKVEELNAIARKILRQEFFQGDVGLSGVNMAVAETGTLCLVENEGNGRMCTTVPPVHIAVMGLEKVVEKLTDVPPLLRLLTGSATGQLITTYVNMITSPRKKGEKDGPKEVHLILLDNGRSEILADPQLRQTLQCIRCGTCLNHCPVYTRIGGHAYGFVYPGPIGKILTPQMEGLEKAGGLVTASSLCNACEEVCPVKIPIPELIRRLRDESYDTDGNVKGHGYKKTLAETLVWKGWELMNRHPGLNALGTKMAGIFSPVLPEAGPLKAWTSVRSKPQFARKSLHERVREEGVEHE
ncbi:MAG: LutB/LldF family L-lactate oxidation iron-sulfur protein [Desulfococcaceae bacterium]|jgi:L-lactate dehydrogenase complex protein LldF|nr:LutB/LldF family L-lactate oxidation iron-sulfur protein [Desulfococcaceae bacterium]